MPNFEQIATEFICMDIYPNLSSIPEKKSHSIWVEEDL